MVGWAKRCANWAAWANGHWAHTDENKRKQDWAARDGQTENKEMNREG
jgi:hypothetical protein